MNIHPYRRFRVQPASVNEALISKGLLVYILSAGTTTSTERDGA